MHIYLYGPPGAGKSTIGEIVARNLRLPFVDLDRVVESNAGMSIPQIMERQGESGFRDLETAALNSLPEEGEQVVALGGGSLIRKENRARVEGIGRVVLLAAGAATLLERLADDRVPRPLLEGNSESKLWALLEKRAEHYGSFPIKVPVDGMSPEQVAQQVQVILGRHRLSAMGGCDVRVGGIPNLSIGNSIVITDANVGEHLAETVAGFKSKVLTFPAGEKHKNLETVVFLWKSFLEHKLDRKSTVIAVGGGVVCDLAGFAAATYMRGVDWIAIPTTLLAMVDASLGGKTGFDLPEGKNLIGSFHSPKSVLADPDLLLTLPEREFRSGMAEVVKHGVISSPELFELCSDGMDRVKRDLEEVVKLAMAVKIDIVEKDPLEQGVRAVLNLGHTVGHAVELVSNFELRHGEAVSIGMVAEARYAERIGLADRGTAGSIRDVLSGLGLPVEIPAEFPRDAILRAMRVDKKKQANSIRFALPVEIGMVELVEVDALEEVLED